MIAFLVGCSQEEDGVCDPRSGGMVIKLALEWPRMGVAVKGRERV